MAQFDVYQHKQGKNTLLLVDVQSHLLSDLETRIVIPLIPLSQAKAERATRLKPVLNLSGQDYVLLTTDMSAQLKSNCGELLFNIEHPHRDTIINAIDFLILGF